MRRSVAELPLRSPLKVSLSTTESGLSMVVFRPVMLRTGEHKGQQMGMRATGLERVAERLGGQDVLASTSSRPLRRLALLAVFGLVISVMGSLPGAGGAVRAAPFDVTVAAGGNAPSPVPLGESIGFIDAIEVDDAGNLWVTDRRAGLLRKFASGSTRTARLCAK